MADLVAVERRLREILAPYGDRFSVRDTDGGLTIELPGHEGEPWGFVAGTRLGKRYASYYLMSVYAQPELLGAMSPALRRRMQGKSCFNFSSIDEGLLDELAALTARAIEGHGAAIAAAIDRSPRRRSAQA
jgi:hypothetical protein